MNTVINAGRGCLLLLAMALGMAAQNASAELVGLSDHGFTSQHQRTVMISPDSLYKNLSHINQWWEADHTWGGDASKLSLDLVAAGCFCEALPGGGWVEHLRIIYLAPGREVRLRGALGPLMEMGLEGTMIWRLSPNPDGTTTIDWRYVVQGSVEGGFAELAPAVDAVNRIQLDNLVQLGTGD